MSSLSRPCNHRHTASHTDVLTVSSRTAATSFRRAKISTSVVRTILGCSLTSSSMKRSRALVVCQRTTVGLTCRQHIIELRVRDDPNTSRPEMPGVELRSSRMHAVKLRSSKGKLTNRLAMLSCMLCTPTLPHSQSRLAMQVPAKSPPIGWMDRSPSLDGGPCKFPMS